ncbi:hypothetical protein [Anaerorhabdus sp.]|uniref:hypothetical protein n=1 Tax=Anaerorhabdus sp. TaxID=1872524 RepID=UPI002FCCB458
MKKGLLTTLLLASGAALAVYLLKEEQDKKADVDDEIRMIKLRSDEEDKELVRTIQEIENLPLKDIHEIDHDYKSTKQTVDHKETPFIDLDDISDIDIPSIKEMAPVQAAGIIGAAMTASKDVLEDLRVPSFVQPKEETIKFDEPVIEEIIEEPIVVAEPTIEEILEEVELPEEPVEEVINTIPDFKNEDLQKLIQDIESSTNENEEDNSLLVEDDHLNDLLEDLVVPTFVERPKPDANIKFETLMHPFGEPAIKTEEIITPTEEDIQEVLQDTIEEVNNDNDWGTFEIPTMVQPSKKEFDDENLSKTAIFDLPKFENVNQPIEDSQNITMRNPFGDDDLDEIDLTSLFEEFKPTQSIVESAFDPTIEETSELKLVDLDDEEIKRLFTIDDDEDDLEEITLEPIHQETPQLKKELTQDEFEEFKKRLIHVGEDDIDLINLNDAQPFETVEEPHVEEIDIINFGNIVAEPTIALEDLVLDKPLNISEIQPIEDEEEIEELQFPSMQPILEEDELDIPTLSPFEEDDDLEEISLEPVEEREFPDAVYDISSLYPYLNLKFINTVFNNFEVFNDEFEIGTGCRITHKVQFPESQNLISFIEIIKEYGYEINGTDENHNILIYLDFENQESKILSEIYNISNQVNYLDGLYKGYELEHI